jgi:O-antigen biosynthesis protein WbqV
MTANPPAEVARALPHVFDPEFDDRYERLLLGRDPVEIEQPELAGVVGGRTVLVTGAGGSIGSRLSLLLARLAPARLVLLDSSEHNLFTINEILRQHAPETVRTLALCDVRDERALDRWFTRTGPELVFHAAALKHVPLLEEQVEEAVLTNVLGTLNVARMARRHEVGVAVLLSTDKAVNPVSVMGATKRCAELLFQAFAGEGGHDGPRFISVRFGNVLGSTGSVVPLFERRSPKADP